MRGIRGGWKGKIGPNRMRIRRRPKTSLSPWRRTLFALLWAANSPLLYLLSVWTSSSPILPPKLILIRARAPHFNFCHSPLQPGVFILCGEIQSAVSICMLTYLEELAYLSDRHILFLFPQWIVWPDQFLERAHGCSAANNRVETVWTGICFGQGRQIASQRRQLNDLLCGWLQWTVLFALVSEITSHYHIMMKSLGNRKSESKKV